MITSSDLGNRDLLKAIRGLAIIAPVPALALIRSKVSIESIDLECSPMLYSDFRVTCWLKIEGINNQQLVTFGFSNSEEVKSNEYDYFVKLIREKVMFHCKYFQRPYA